MKYKPKWLLEAQKEGKHPFFITIPIIKDYHRQNTTTIVGLGTRFERSRTGHRMNPQFIQKMKTTVQGKPLLVNHDPNQVAGNVTDVKPSAEDEFIPLSELLTPHENPIVDAPRAKVEHWLENNVQLGYSVGGIIEDFKITKEDTGQFTHDVLDGEVMEMSITPIPAVKSSDGTIRVANTACPDGICGQIVQQIINGPALPIMESVKLKQETTKNGTVPLHQSTGYVLNEEAFNHAVALINEGQVDLETPWNRGIYVWRENKGQFRDLCLGVDPTGGDMDEVRYPVGMEGTVYKSAIIQVASEAPWDSRIYEAAEHLLLLVLELDADNGLMEENTMTELEQLQNDLKDLTGIVKQQSEVITEMVKEKESKEKAAEEARVKQEAEAHEEELVKTITQAATEAAGAIIDEKLKGLMKDRTGVKQTSTTEEGEHIKREENLAQNLRDPVNYPAVVAGKVVQGVTPREAFQVN